MTVSILVAGYLGLNPPGFAAGTVALAFGLADSLGYGKNFSVDFGEKLSVPT